MDAQNHFPEADSFDGNHSASHIVQIYGRQDILCLCPAYRPSETIDIFWKKIHLKADGMLQDKVRV